MRLIDLHCHLVPGVDDGPANSRESEELLSRLRQSLPPPAAAFATPHLRLSEARGRLAFLGGRIDEFVRQAGMTCGDALRIGASVEVMLDGSPFRRGVAESLCYPGTDWILVEVPPGLPGFAALHRIRAVSRAGFRPLVAHPERYGFSRHEASLEKLIEAGAALQVSTRSLASSSDELRKAAWRILLSGYCSILASDCHSADDPLLPDSEAEVCSKMGRIAWTELCSANPGRILDGKPTRPVAAG
jgi:protein-tyrosine phosphatase